MTDIVDQLRSARAAYDEQASSHYDEVLLEVSARAETSGSLGKVDLGALVAWKRLQANTPWMAKLMGTPETEVRAITARARKAALDESVTLARAADAARDILGELPGCGHGHAVASAILTASAPRRMAVYDRRARAGLSVLFDGNIPRWYSYPAYMETVDHLRAQVGPDWTNRDVDLALYKLGGREPRTP
ncbi:hypothetical protein [Ornithinimicrobium sediminis]|uniref:hypothetical protein n=1 Tax=Ornithinimicrobium sediminis TaxID=2904603 RepID=UPI001E636CAB|nr:hypothetical protein [Ornithinimicrobium sediminis]MCE0488135.1 hypothetical protein [Ornithinimicrobium sediminis]